jgi:predicted ATP-grasp superfamily ATP-dependent carboligase
MATTSEVDPKAQKHVNDITKAVMEAAQTHDTKEVIITHLNHDLTKKRSIVGLAGEDGSERRLFLPVKYRTTPDEIMVEATKALKECSEDLARTTLKLP